MFKSTDDTITAVDGEELLKLAAVVVVAAGADVVLLTKTIDAAPD